MKKQFPPYSPLVGPIDSQISETYRNLLAIDQYHQAVAAYRSKTFELTDEQIDNLILFTNSNHASYSDFKKVIPALNSSTLCAYLSDIPKPPENVHDNLHVFNEMFHQKPHYFQLETTPRKFVYPYTFSPTDCFTLTVTGLNRLYTLKKELRLLELAKQSASFAETSTKYARLAYIATVIGIVVATTGTVLSLLYQK